MHGLLVDQMTDGGRNVASDGDGLDSKMTDACRKEEDIRGRFSRQE